MVDNTFDRPTSDVTFPFSPRCYEPSLNDKLVDSCQVYPVFI